MRYAKKQMYFFLILTVVGILALLAALIGDYRPEYRTGLVSGITGGFILTGVLGMLISARLIKNPDKAEKIENAKMEERTEFLRLKTHSAVYTSTTVLTSAGTVAFMLLGQRTVAIAFAVLLMVDVVLYVGFAAYYNRKY